MENALLSKSMYPYDAEIISSIIPEFEREISQFVGEPIYENVIKFALKVSEQSDISVKYTIPLFHELNQAWWVTNYVKPYDIIENEDCKAWFYCGEDCIIDYFDGRGPDFSEVWVEGPYYHAIPRAVYCDRKLCQVRVATLYNIHSENTTVLLPDTLERLSADNLGHMKYKPKTLKAFWVDPDNPVFYSENGDIYIKKDEFYNPTGEKKLHLSHDLVTDRGPIINQSK